VARLVKVQVCSGSFTTIQASATAMEGHLTIYGFMTFFLCLMGGLAVYGFMTKRRRASSFKA
jgi:hypothetical protein